jgi:hypothetical protein
VHLSIAIPEAQVVEAPALLRIVRMAPACDAEADEQGASYVALFDDFPKSVEIVVRLIEEAWDLRDIHITLEGRPVVSRINFYAALRCYHESLGAPDAKAYCLQQAAKVGTDGGCPDRPCESPCQFICSRCVGLSRERGAPPISIQLLEMARRAEVDWCPNLRIAKVDA